MDFDGMIGELGLTDRQARRLARWMERDGRRPGVPHYVQSQPGAAQPVPALEGAVIPWHHPELLGLRPPQWSAADHEAAIRAILGAPKNVITGRATFTAGTNQTASADLQSQNATFLMRNVAYVQSVPANPIIGEVKQAKRFSPWSGNPARLEAVFGTDGDWIPWMTLVVPNEGFQINCTAEGVVGAGHYVDFVAHGWIVGMGKLPAGA